MEGQTFDLVNANWRSRELRRRRVDLFVPLAYGFVAIAADAWVGLTHPSSLGLAVGLSVTPEIVLIGVILVTSWSDPVALAISPFQLRFTRNRGRSFTVNLSATKMAVSLIDQSAELRFLKRPDHPDPPYFGSFGWRESVISLTPEAFVAIQQALSRAGFTEFKSVGILLQPRTVQWVYRKNG
jgi:hypothetical protein